MSGVGEPKLLIASHIVPWSQLVEHRLNPGNGLCLSALHDGAFDRGLITVTPEYVIRISKRLQRERRNDLVRSGLLGLDGKKIRMPRRFPPAKEFLSRHNELFESQQRLDC